MSPASPKHTPETMQRWASIAQQAMQTVVAAACEVEEKVNVGRCESTSGIPYSRMDKPRLHYPISTLEQPELSVDRPPNATSNLLLLQPVN